MEKLDELSIEIANRNKILTQNLNASEITSNEIDDAPSSVDISQVLLVNPNISQTKGRNKEDKVTDSLRRKSAMEVAQKKKGRRCNSCGMVNANHDTRTCPKNPNRKKNNSSKSIPQNILMPISSLVLMIRSELSQNLSWNALLQGCKDFEDNQWE
ncbi:hypothetical protein FRX31_032486 [Thalictrum thalictroides]|uniref:Uncharacterized protein n=1 Tax=Thalictrum thalictroides TaxID=46969 RepID=A0A7J6UZ51_THATH|nr:hypothetical protein FRX31_032486 [Thalictrum thalictroides]